MIQPIEFLIVLTVSLHQISCIIYSPIKNARKTNKYDLPNEKFFKQNLNHFDHTDERTWLQVYLKTYFHQFQF